jgi:hypothetical protein
VVALLARFRMRAITPKPIDLVRGARAGGGPGGPQRRPPELQLDAGPSPDGGKVLEIATDYASDGTCKPYFATGPIG